jgi:hypothetical protein
MDESRARAPLALSLVALGVAACAGRGTPPWPTEAAESADAAALQAAAFQHVAELARADGFPSERFCLAMKRPGTVYVPGRTSVRDIPSTEPSPELLAAIRALGRDVLPDSQCGPWNREQTLGRVTVVAWWPTRAGGDAAVLVERFCASGSSNCSRGVHVLLRRQGQRWSAIRHEVRWGS